MLRNETDIRNLFRFGAQNSEATDLGTNGRNGSGAGNASDDCLMMKHSSHMDARVSD